MAGLEKMQQASTRMWLKSNGTGTQLRETVIAQQPLQKPGSTSDSGSTRRTALLACCELNQNTLHVASLDYAVCKKCEETIHAV